MITLAPGYDCCWVLPARETAEAVLGADVFLVAPVTLLDCTCAVDPAGGLGDRRVVLVEYPGCGVVDEVRAREGHPVHHLDLMEAPAGHPLVEWQVEWLGRDLLHERAGVAEAGAPCGGPGTHSAGFAIGSGEVGSAARRQVPSLFVPFELGARHDGARLLLPLQVLAEEVWPDSHIIHLDEDF